MTTSQSGLFAQIGFGDETTPGNDVAPTYALPFTDESLDAKPARIDGDEIISGRAGEDSSQWAPGLVTVGGDTKHVLYPTGIRKHLDAMFGPPSSTSGSGPYVDTYTPVAGNLGGHAKTVQKGVPGVGGVISPVTLSGCKCASWAIGFKAGEKVTHAITWVGMKAQIGSRVTAAGVTTSGSPNISDTGAAFTNADVDKLVSGSITGIPAGTYIKSVTDPTHAVMTANATATTSSNAFTIGRPLAAATFPSPLPSAYTFLQSTVSANGQTVKVKEGTLAGDNGLAVDRDFCGQRWIDEPLEASTRKYTGTITMEFTDLAQQTLFFAGTEFALVVTFTQGANSI